MASTQVFILLFTCSCLLILSTAHGDEKQTNQDNPANYYLGARKQAAGYYNPRSRKQPAGYYYPGARKQPAGYYYPGAREQPAGYYNPRIREQPAGYYYHPQARAREQVADPRIWEKVADYYDPRSRVKDAGDRYSPVRADEAYHPEEAKEASSWICFDTVGCQGQSIRVNGPDDCCYNKEWSSYRNGNDQACFTCIGCSTKWGQCWKRCGSENYSCWRDDTCTSQADCVQDRDRPCATDCTSG